MRISVFGIGYVGAVTSACLADSGHHVIAVDPDPIKVNALTAGRSPIVEEGLNDLLKKVVAEGRLEATSDYEYAVNNTDISLVCVGTPSRSDGSLNLDYVVACSEQIGSVIKTKDTYHSVVIRSTVVPGTLEQVVKPALEKVIGKTAGVDFGLGNNPEFLREGTAIADYYKPNMIVAGALDQKTSDMIINLYEGIDGPRAVCSVAESEGVKYVSNAWRANKVSFANEIGNILSDHGVDSHNVMNIFFLDDKINLGKSFLLPGFAFGGSCLPKDVKAIRASANNKGLKTPLFDSLLAANKNQVERGFKLIEQSGKKNVGLMGLSFKPDTDDLRESPLVDLAQMLLDNGYSLKIYDPCVTEASNMESPTKYYLQNDIPKIAACLVSDVTELTETSDLIVIGNGTKSFGPILDGVNDNCAIIDLVRIKSNVTERDNYKGICW